MRKEGNNDINEEKNEKGRDKMKNMTETTRKYKAKQGE